jgi:hypothetical protein
MKINIWLNLGLETATTLLAGGCASMGGNLRPSASNLFTSHLMERRLAAGLPREPTCNPQYESNSKSENAKPLAERRSAAPTFRRLKS